MKRAAMCRYAALKISFLIYETIDWATFFLYIEYRKIMYVLTSVYARWKCVFQHKLKSPLWANLQARVDVYF